MKTYQVILLSLFIVGVILGTSCSSDDQKQDPEKTVKEFTDRESEELAMNNSDCPSGVKVICNQGLSFAHLGKPVAELHAFDALEGVEEADSLDYEMGYVRLNRSFSFAEGFILLEGDALIDSTATDSDISATNLSRIRIEADQFKTPDGVHRGMTISELREIYTDEEMPILSFATLPDFSADPKYHFLVLNPEKYPNITYLLPDPGHQIYRSINKEEINLSDLPADKKISSIVVSV